jgi:hypothetical protein
MTMFLLVTRKLEANRSERRFAIVNPSFLETKRNVLKSTISVPSGRAAIRAALLLGGQHVQCRIA